MTKTLTDTEATELASDLLVDYCEGIFQTLRRIGCSREQAELALEAAVKEYFEVIESFK